MWEPFGWTACPLRSPAEGRPGMEQMVRVREVYPDGTALVIHIRESACSGDCHKCSGCGAAKEAIELKAENPLGAKVGNIVTVSAQTGPVLKAAAVLYVLPLVLFFLGYWLGAAGFGFGALGGCLGFVLGIGAIVLYDRRMGKTVYTITGFAEDSLLKSMKKGDNNHG